MLPADRSIVPVDNQIYVRLADRWWGEDSPLSMLRTALNPVRFGYMRRVVETLGIDPAGKGALDIGCGGGLLAEEFARLGFRVTGVDPSAESLETARAHAAESGLDIEYREGTGEQLPFEDSSFDLAYCCDVLEHVDDVEQVVRETARVLRPGGVYLYDTINRTLRSRLIMIKLFQEWESTAFMEPNLHDWKMFIKPRELERALQNAGLEPAEAVGIGARNPIAALREARRRARGEITHAELGRRMQMRETRDRSGLYAGYAVKPR
jgi:2-polyprenyl-6-hydroxyphenyl methylase/3-demethylubiquinone-9 3-methyltransferase